jgi:tripartite-type tricarboxylate transporter receptor subunit TctC
MAGIELVPVPYKGGPLSLVDLLGGRVSCMVTSVPVAFPLVKDGTVRALAVTGTARSSGLPNIPRISEFVPGYEVDSWWGVVAPAGTPKHIISRLKVEITQILGMPDVKEYYLRLGIEPAVSTPAEFAMLIKAEITKWSRVIKDAGIHPQ